MPKQDPKDFIHLQVHCHYSLTDALGSPAAVAKQAKELGYSAIALTDHGVMHGGVELAKACKKEGIKPIIGCEANVAIDSRFDKRHKIDNKSYSIVLLAKNLKGYQGLLKMSTKAHLEGYYYRPRIDHDLLKEYGKDLIALSGAASGQIARVGMEKNYEAGLEVAKTLVSFFEPGDFYIQLCHKPGHSLQAEANRIHLQVAEELNLPIIGTSDVHYLKPTDNKAHDILVCIGQQKVTADDRRISYMNDDYSMTPPDKLIDLFPDHLDEIIKNCQEISDKIDFDLELDQDLLPIFDCPDGLNDQEFLRKLVEEGVCNRYSLELDNLSNPQTDEHKTIAERMNYELEVIGRMGFASYFLIIWDFMIFAKKERIVTGPGRGSAAGAMITYALEITALDPLEYDLLFERFLNPDRISMPDIDLDFSDIRRHEVIKYVVDKYGEDCVAHVRTFSTMAARAAVRDVARAMDVAYAEADHIAKLIPDKPGTKLKDAVEEPELSDDLKNNASHKEIVDNALILEGTVRHCSIHACAVVISKSTLTDFTALQDAPKGDMAILTQYEANALEDIGLLKMDFLGLKTLTVIETCINIVKKNHDIDIDISKIGTTDEKAFELLQAGNTTGVFQLESPGMKRYLKELKPSVFDDIIAMVSLYRPGPMQYIETFINRKHGREEIKYAHPAMAEALANTYGVTVYQEQVMNLSKILAGFTGGQADTLRKAMGKKIISMMDELKIEFVKGVKEKHNIDERTASSIWADWEEFAKYAFNKSHAACYALIAFQTAYLKAHYPAEFMAALMTSDQGDTDRIVIEMMECKENKIDVIPPNVNISVQNFGVNEDGAVVFGLGAVKGLGEGPIKAIIDAREEGGPFKSITDFAQRVEASAINKRALEALTGSGALDELGERKALMDSVEQISKYAKSAQASKESGQMDIFGVMEEEDETGDLELSSINRATKKELLQWEKEYMGLYVTQNPLEELGEYFFSRTTPINQINEKHVGENIRLGGLVTATKRIITKKGDPMMFGTLEGLTGKIELVVFPRTYESYSEIISDDKVLITEGKISEKEGQYSLLVNKAREVDIDNVKTPTSHKSIGLPLTINLPDNFPTHKMTKLKELLASARGGQDKCVIIQMGVKKELSFTINDCEKLQKGIATIINAKNKR